MTELASTANRILAVGVHTHVCALPLMQVIETMRPLPVEPIVGVPSFVRGVSIVRGVPTPVVDLGALLGMPGGVAGRFVTLRVGERQVALSVQAVLGVHNLDSSKIQKLPPLFQEASNDVIEAMGTLDTRLLVVLRQGWALPDEVWKALAVDEVFG
jgi:purine-binding chemotaxis protein CheW